MKRELQRQYIIESTVGDPVQDLVSSLLPEPMIEYSAELRDKFAQALLAIGCADCVSTLPPDTPLFS